MITVITGAPFAMWFVILGIFFSFGCTHHTLTSPDSMCYDADGNMTGWLISLIACGGVLAFIAVCWAIYGLIIACMSCSEQNQELYQNEQGRTNLDNTTTATAV